MRRTIRRSSVAVAKKGKWLSWSKAPLAKAPNAHVFFDFVREVQSRE